MEQINQARKERSEEERRYRKARVHVLGKTSNLLQGDYGQYDDGYRRYRELARESPKDKPKPPKSKKRKPRTSK
jgi:hypothetical protein